jgi:hypothetical protein
MDDQKAKFYETLLDLLALTHNDLLPSLGSMVLVDIGPAKCWRFEELNELTACFLKNVKCVSTLYGILSLLKAGHAQEANALIRIVGDCANEVLYLLTPKGENGEYDKNQMKFLNDFFQEEFNRPHDPLGSEQKRDQVGIAKIHAGFGKMLGEILNPHDAAEMARTEHKTFSGYIHGAYPHIMEMTGGPTVGFRMKDMLGTPRIDEAEQQFITYLHRATMNTVALIRKSGAGDPWESLIKQAEDQLLVVSKREERNDPKKMLATYKAKAKAAEAQQPRRAEPNPDREGFF